MIGGAQTLTVNRNVNPGSVQISWTTGGTTYSLTDDGVGNLAGDGTGKVLYFGGHVSIKPNPMPRPSDGDFTVQYDEWGGSQLVTESITPSSSQITYNTSGPIYQGSLRISFQVQRIKVDYDSASPDNQKETLDTVIYDDANGNLLRDGQNVGTVDYANGSVTFTPVLDYTYKSYDTSYTGGQWNTVSDTDQVMSGSGMSIAYQSPSDPINTKTKSVPIPGLQIPLVTQSNRQVIQGSVLFDMAGKTYRDRQGTIITDWQAQTDAGNNVGSIDYSTGTVTLTDWPPGTDPSAQVNLIACVTRIGTLPSKTLKFRTAGAPLREGSFTISGTFTDGTVFSYQANTDGSITGTGISSGSVDTKTGTVTITFDDTHPVFPDGVTYSAVAYSYLPLDPDLIGLNPTRLPSDGRVPIFNAGDVVVVSNTKTTTVSSPTAGQQIIFSRDHQAEVWVEDGTGARLDPAQYTVDKVGGTLTFADPLTLQDANGSSLSAPLTVYDRVEDMALATDVQIGGTISVNAALSQDYDTADTIVSSAVPYGDLRARVYNLFHQKSWDGNTWKDARVGDDTTAKYNNVTYPIQITNQGSIKERWAIRFTSNSSFEIIGETVGVVGTGNTTTDAAPTNDATGAPYFTIKASGWGAGWVAGNIVRFNTDGAQAPFWAVRTVTAGAATVENDYFATQNRGDAD